VTGKWFCHPWGPIVRAVSRFPFRRNFRKPVHSIIPALLAVVLSFSFLIPVHAGKSPLVNLTSEERTWLDRNPEKLTLYFNVEFPPIEFSSASGTFVGMGADVIEMVERRLGTVFRKYPSDDWNRHLSALESGECAIAPTIVRTAERERYAFFTKPYATVPVVIISARDEPAGLTLDHLDGKRIAVVSGYATEGYLQGLAHGRFEVVPMPDVPQGLRAVSFGQVDAFVENLAVAAYYIKQEGIPNLQVAGSTDYKFAWSIGVSRKYPLLYSAVQKALDGIAESDLEAVRNRWISLQIYRGIRGETKRLLALAFVFTVLLLLGLAGISYFLKRRLNEKVTHLRTAQQELAQSEARFRAIFDYAPYAIIINGLEDGRFLEANKAFLNSQGGSREELLGMRFRDLVLHTEDEVKVTFDALVKKGFVRNIEATIRKNDGTPAHVIFSSVLLELQEQKQILSMAVDVTEKKQAEKALRESEMRFRSLFKMAPLPLAEVSLDGKIVEVNEPFIQIMGYGMDEIAMLSHLWEFAFPDRAYRDRAESAWQTALDLALETGSVIKSNEYQVHCKDGMVRTMLIGASLIGESLLVSFVDITERKRAEDERQKLQEQLLQSQKLEAVGILAGGVAHDFNNMLGAIIGYAELTRDRMDFADPMRRNLEKILDVARRSANLTRQLLAFARKETVTPIIFDLNESVEAMLKMLRRLIGENIDLAWLPGAGPCTVYMDPSQLDQILANLCVNARDAIADVGRITIRTDRVSFDETSRELNADCLPGDFILLAVSDNGSGMDPEILDHIFEPFFTTKVTGQGTGLGLATIYGVVKQNEGFIHVDSEPGRGTTFNIYLPRHAVDTVAQKDETGDSLPCGRGETILMVEDDPAVQEMGQMILQRLGYIVLSAAMPGEAIRIAEENRYAIQLLITDVVMPEMNGRELADRLLAIRPKMKHIFMSGYTADVIVHRGVLDEGINFIQKPFTIKELAVKIRAVLDQA